MQDIIESAIRVIGWLVLKGVTLGRYRSRGSSDLLLEGGVGLACVVLLFWAAYVWWPA